jgi:hypothetical protein
MNVNSHNNRFKTLSIQRLLQGCHLPGKCGQKLECEGKIYTVEGYIDFSNIFSKDTYPNVSYEKFFLVDTHGNVLEVVTRAIDNRAVFQKLGQMKSTHDAFVSITGKVEGIDCPTMGKCMRSIRLIIYSPGDIVVR